MDDQKQSERRPLRAPNAIKALRALISKSVVIETKLGGRFKGVLTDLKYRTMTIGPAKVRFPTAVVLDGDGYGAWVLTELVSIVTSPE